MLVNKKIKTIFMLVVMILSLLGIGIIVIITFAADKDKNVNPSDYQVNTEFVDTKQKSLDPKMLYKAIDSKYLASSIEIKIENVANYPINLSYRPVFNPEKFQYSFIKQFIKSFPQWKTNKLFFSYNSFYNKVWVRYETENDNNYLNWVFTINSKI